MTETRIVLVRSKYPRNIGMVSRAMVNFGLSKLILIDPQCEIDFEARQGAAQGQAPLRHLTRYSCWEEFYRAEPEGLRIAFSRRNGRRRPSEPFSQFLKNPMLREGRPTYLIFGAEDHGLAFEDMDLIHRVCHFHLPGEMQSMNLSHSVVFALTLMSQSDLRTAAKPAVNAEVAQSPEPALRLWLESMNFDLETHQRWNALVALKQMLLRSAPSNKEINLLDSVIHQTVRRLKNSKGKTPETPSQL